MNCISHAPKILMTSLEQLLPARLSTAHKGDFGHVLVLGGDYGMAGAVRMAAEAAARIGAGLVSVATRLEHTLILTTARPEIMCFGVRCAFELTPLLQRSTVLALGPGLGQSAWSRRLFRKTVTIDQPKVVDADALNLLACSPMRREDWILTPHPGEAARLLDSTPAAIQADRVQAALALQRRYGGCIVLKGAGTIVIDYEQTAQICMAGNPGMASGGMGDVLTGVIAGLLAQGLSLAEAAATGVYLHARAGDLAAQAGERGLLATDLILQLRQLANPCQATF